MACTFPKVATSVDEWLEALNLGKYKESFRQNKVLAPPQLLELTDDFLKLAGVKIPGHRKRMMQGMLELSEASTFGAAGAGSSSSGTASCSRDAAEPMEMDCTQPPQSSEVLLTPQEQQQAKEQQRFNSTSSIYISSTITAPDTDEIIFCVAIVIHDRVVQGEAMPLEVRERFRFFSEDNHPLYAPPRDPAGGSHAAVDDAPVAANKRTRREIPAEDTIYYTMRSVYECARFPAECLIVSLVYVERIVAVSGVPILVTSWRPILLASLILAQKVWNDRSLHNVDFSTFCPMFTLKEINHLEQKFLELIDYDVSISASLYASYYFQLRTLCQRANRDFSLKPMEVEQAAALEARGLQYQQKFSEGAGKKYQSANDIYAPRSAKAPMAAPSLPGSGSGAPPFSGGRGFS